MGEAQGQSQFASRMRKGNPLKDSLEESLFNGYGVPDLQDEKVVEICYTTM